MSWVEARLTAFSLPLARPVSTARGALRERRGWLVRLFDAEAREGHATAMPIEGFGRDDFDACGAALAAWLAGHAPLDGQQVPFAASAAALATSDLDARRRGVPLAEALALEGQGVRTSLRVNALVGAADADTVAANVRAADAFEVIKLKVGDVVDEAVRCVDAACAALRPGQLLRIDPNSSWNEADAERLLGGWEGRPIEYVEQPVSDRAALGRLRSTSPVRVAADESASTGTGLRAVLVEGAADVVVMKPMAVGGPTRALELAREVERAGVDLTITSLLDSVIGVRAAAAVAFATPRPPLACGLATTGLFERDLVKTKPCENGARLVAWQEPGLGTLIDEAALEFLAIGPTRSWARP